MKHLIGRKSEFTRYLTGWTGDDNFTFDEEYSLYNIGYYKISDQMYNTLKPEWILKSTEIDPEVAEWGVPFFGEIREVAKIYEANEPHYPGVKVPTRITPEIQDKIVKFMYVFAKEIIEDEYERRFLQLRNTNSLEAWSWEIQKAEAKEWLEFEGSDGHITPFLDYLASEKGIDRTALANKILEKAEDWQDRLSTMLVEQQKLIKKFKNATTVWDLNILYEDYLGVQMPHSQARELGRMLNDETDERKPEYDDGLYEFGF